MYKKKFIANVVHEHLIHIVVQTALVTKRDIKPKLRCGELHSSADTSLILDFVLYLREKRLPDNIWILA